MQQIKKLLKKRLKGVKRLGILAIGSELRGDDIVGFLVIQDIEKKKKKIASRVKIETFFGSTAPESITGVIKKFKPTHLMIVDAACTSKKPGDIVIGSPKEEDAATTFATHRLPMQMFAKYLCNFFPCEVILVGIQPKNLKFASIPTKLIQTKAKKVSSLILEILEEL
jgi:hydrogenase 3 maturation protease